MIALSLAPGVGPTRVRALLAAFGSARAVLRAKASALKRVEGVGEETARSVVGFDGSAEVERQRALAKRCEAALIAPWSPAFPVLLNQLYDPPAFLWMRGTLTAADARAVAIVGTRRASDYGRRVARDFAAGLARRGLTVVSGLAYGIDAEAHRGALAAGGRTIAVLGSGVGRIYPSKHIALARAIVEQGAVLSEYGIDAEPDAPNFPRRNRLISGLTFGTIIVEAFEDGGALITARTALEQNREVFAIPGPIGSAPSRGTHRLIQAGAAKLVTCVEDVLEELPLALQTATEPPQEAVPLPRMKRQEAALYEVLGADPLHIDTVCERAGLEVSTALVHLLGLEMKGVVVQMAGKQFARCRRM